MIFSSKPTDPCVGNYTFVGTNWTVLWSTMGGNITFTMSGPFPGWFGIGFQQFPDIFSVSVIDPFLSDLCPLIMNAMPF